MKDSLNKDYSQCNGSALMNSYFEIDFNCWNAQTSNALYFYLLD